MAWAFRVPAIWLGRNEHLLLERKPMIDFFLR
jgi:hypothetical protein